MRKLIVARGAPGSGKSSLLQRAGLQHWTLSSDAIRATIAAPFLTSDGRLIANQEINGVVFATLFQRAEERMRRGELLAIDTTLFERGDMTRWLHLARKFRYKLALLDMSTVPLSTAYERNWLRGEIERVPEQRIAEMHQQIVENDITLPDGAVRIEARPDGSELARLNAWAEADVADLSSYREVVHIGDIQGCFSVLAGAGGPLEDGFRDDTFYVFIGDLLDRGIENDRVLRWYIDNALGRPNVVLLHGNHEDHLLRWANGDALVSNEFLRRTLPQLEAAGLTPEDAGLVVDTAQDFMRYHYRGTQVLASHAGLSTWPRAPHLVSLEQYSHGTGYWSDPVDEQFMRNSHEGIQVHGHRNAHAVPVLATARSFNLEDSVEFGGNLRTVSLGGDGWTPREYPNRVYLPYRDRVAIEVEEAAPGHSARRVLIPDWIATPRASDTKLDADVLATMQAHEGVRERDAVQGGTVKSLNFSKAVFFEANWDTVTIKARGLFYSPATREIVARGYSKFFNIGEREETSVSSLRNTLVYPLRAYIKENGFLGLIGYDEGSDTLFVSSKSMADGAFAAMFRRILDHGMPAGLQERLKRYLRNNEACLICEVIDPVGDPHMIEYDHPKIILLDVVRRSTLFERAEPDVRKAVARQFGLEAKRLALQFRNTDAFEGWLRRATKRLDYRIDGQHVEGLVIEDATGRMVKVKLPHYALWKKLRAQKDRIINCRAKGLPYTFPGLREHDGVPIEGASEIAERFLAWCETQDTETLQRDIIQLRTMFEAALVLEDVEAPAP